MSWFRTRYRIVRDGYAGYEVQSRRWWFPIWIQVSRGGSGINTWATLEGAENFARGCMHQVVKEVIR